MVKLLFYSTIGDFLKTSKIGVGSSISTFYMTAFSDVDSNAQTSMPPYQRGFYQISFIESSVASSVKWSNSKDLNINKTVYFLSPEHIFSWKWAKDVKGYLIFFDKSFLNFSRIHLEEEFHELFDFRRENILNLSDEESHELQRNITKLYEDYNEHNQFKMQILQSGLLSLLFKLKNIYLQHEVKKGYVLTRTQIKYREFQNLIKNSFITQKTVKYYADQLFISPNYLNEICKKNVQKNAKKLIQEHIINEAKKLLLYTSDDIAEIGFQLGYDEATHFVRFFKKEVGKTPNEFRKLNSVE